MAKQKVKALDDPEDPWAYYRSIQLTPEQKAAARKQMEEDAERARREGVYEGILSLIGKVHLDMDDLRRLREDDD